MWERWTVHALWLCFYYYYFCLYCYYYFHERCGFTANRKELTSCPEHPYCTSQQHAPPLTDKDMKVINTNTNNFRSSSEHKHYTSWTADNSHQMMNSSHFQSLPWFSLVIMRSQETCVTMGFPFLTLQSDILRTGSSFPASQISSTVHLSSSILSEFVRPSLDNASVGQKDFDE